MLRTFAKLHRHYHPFQKIHHDLARDIEKSPTIGSIFRSFDKIFDNSLNSVRVASPVCRYPVHSRDLWNDTHFRHWQRPTALDWNPMKMSIDVRAAPSLYTIEVTLPGGVKKNNVNLSVNGSDRSLNIIAKRTDSFRTPTAASQEVNVEGSSGNSEVKAEAKDTTSTATNETKDTSSEYTYRESFSGSVERQVSFPEDANLDLLTAKYADGVITIEVPRAEVKQNVRAISFD